MYVTLRADDGGSKLSLASGSEARVVFEVFCDDLGIEIRAGDRSRESMKRR